jgi:hypothetical protein
MHALFRRFAVRMGVLTLAYLHRQGMLDSSRREWEDTKVSYIR